MAGMGGQYYRYMHSSAVLYSSIGRAITSVINRPTKSFVFLKIE